MTMLPATFAALLYLATFAVAQNISFAPAANLTFLQPNFNQTNANGSPRLIRGDNVTIQWQTNFEYTTVMVYQEAESGLFRRDTLASGFPPNRTEVVWNVAAIAGSDGLNGTFHLELRNDVDSTCDGCSLNGPNFVVGLRVIASSTTTSSTQSSTTSVRSSTASSTSANTPPAAAAGAEATQSSSQQAERSGSGNHLGVGLGVGLGLGIPLLLAIAGILFFLSRRRQRRSSLARGRQPSPPDGPDRTSGERQSEKSLAFRPSTAAMSEKSSWSHRSWIEPFHFEQSEVHDEDSTSQLRQSNGSSAPPARSRVGSPVPLFEWEMLDGIPEQPQAVHSRT